MIETEGMILCVHAKRESYACMLHREEREGPTHLCLTLAVRYHCFQPSYEHPNTHTIIFLPLPSIHLPPPSSQSQRITPLRKREPVKNFPDAFLRSDPQDKSDFRPVSQPAFFPVGG